ncbi:Hypothetical predicted protein [Paramuricea clavata]|uniref:Uncharacterized protein n=1 Tax=Paramuricea clavata TaxID=317549 RepID=A0A7D9JSR8_PARCT|nr:Hypothetical predicted protein [Paramuricea clavata]
MDRKRKSDSDRPDVRPSDKVRKCLFGTADEHEKDEEYTRVEQENLSSLEKMKGKYGYDFVEDKHLHLENTPYTVVKIIEAPCEKDLNGEVSSTSVENVEKHADSTIVTPNKQCLEDDDSDSKSSSSNSVNDTLNERTQNGERKCICEIDKAFVESNGQS